MKRPIALALGLCLTFFATTSFAQSSLWDRARDPATSKGEHLSEELEKYMFAQRLLERDTRKRFAADVATRAYFAGVERLPEKRLKCLLGQALLEAERYRRAEEVLAAAVLDLPPGPFGGDCLMSYSIALARQGKLPEELAVLGRALEIVHDAGDRAQVHCNRGATYMELGRLREALLDFRRGVALAATPETQALCQYDLAVALDRNGDAPGAYKSLEVALTIRVAPAFPGSSVLDLPGVFFAPAYEEYYYRALSLMTVARKVDDEEARRRLYEGALGHWQSYLTAAEAAGSRWVLQARLNARVCERALAALKKKPHSAAPRELDFAEPPPSY